MAAIVVMSVSLLTIWLISCPRTPFSSSLSRIFSIPCVTAIAACFGDLPVANAFAVCVGMMYISGLGIFACFDSSSIIL